LRSERSVLTAAAIERLVMQRLLDRVHRIVGTSTRTRTGPRRARSAISLSSSALAAVRSVTTRMRTESEDAIKQSLAGGMTAT
jgi:hypothetical protein